MQLGMPILSERLGHFGSTALKAHIILKVSNPLLQPFSFGRRQDFLSPLQAKANDPFNQGIAGDMARGLCTDEEPSHGLDNVTVPMIIDDVAQRLR